MIGEVFEDGQFRGTAEKIETVNNTDLQVAMHIGDYMVWVAPNEPDMIGISYIPSGETGVFKKADLEPHIAAFFGLNF